MDKIANLPLEIKYQLDGVHNSRMFDNKQEKMQYTLRFLSSKEY